MAKAVDNMDMIVLASLVAVIAFDALALRYGADSRVDDGRRNI